MILYINSCVRSDSRTDWIAKKLLDTLGDYTEVKLDESNLLPLNEERLNYRNDLIEMRDYDNSIFDYAKQFSVADTIVISAPFWDMSFPTLLKTYIENIYITGIVSKYGENGAPIGLCKAKKLYYVATAGGEFDGRFSYDYISNLAKSYFGISETQLIVAENLDIIGADVEKILNDCVKTFVADN